MRLRSFSTVLLSAFLSALSSSALAASPVLYNGVDVSEVIENARPLVKPIVRPFKIYNWSPNGNKSTWSTERAQNDPRNLSRTQDLAEIFWNNYGKNLKGDMYGTGLYGAVDPVTTFGYGGGNYGFSPKPWLLLELQIPAGFKLLVVESADGTGLNVNWSPAAASSLQKFGCPIGGGVNSFFVSGGMGLSASCQGLIRFVFNDQLKIDGFAYMYSSSVFKECNQSASYLGYEAFVITNPDWLKPELIRYFNSLTTSEKEERTRIQTLFLLAQNRNGQPQSLNEQLLPKLREYLVSHENTYVAGSTTKCDGNQCVISVQVCTPDQKCDTLNLDPIPRTGGGVITSQAAQSTEPGGLLWGDLDGAAEPPTISQWIRDNKYACSGVLPFDEAKK